MAFDTWRHLSRRALWGVLAGGLAFACVISAVLGFWVVETRRLYVEQAMQTTRGLATTYKAYTEKLIHEIDLNLNVVASHVRQEGMISARVLQSVAPIFENSLPHMPYVGGISVIDARGVVVHATEAVRAGVRGLDASGRDFHAVHRGDAGLNFHVGRLFPSRVNGEWRLPVSRRLQGTRGEFLGSVVAFVDVRALGLEYARHLKDPAASVTLMYLDGTVLSRTPYLAEQIGKVLPSFARYQGNPPDSNSFIIRSQVDQVTRLIAQRRLEALPLLIAVTLLEEAALAPWRTTLPPVWLLWGGTLLLVMAVCVFMLGQLGRRQGTLADLRESEARLRTVVESFPCGVLLVDAEGRIAWANRLLLDQFGYAPDELLGRDVELLVPAPARAHHAADRRQYQAAAQPRPMGRGRDLYAARKDGSLFPVEIGLQPLVLPTGAATLTMVTDISERKLAEEKLRASLGEKEALLKEIYHRVNNNLQVVSGLLTMQAASAGDEARAQLLGSASRVWSMALVHQLLYQSGDLSRIGLPNYSRLLLGSLRDMHAEVAGRVRSRYEVGELFLGIELAIPLGLLINELVSNCYRHAYPGELSGEFVLRIDERDDGMIELEVVDDGVGLPPGFDPARQTSLGVRLIASLAAQLGGRFEFGTHGGRGTRFVLRFMSDSQRPVPAP